MLKIWGRNTSSNVQKVLWAPGEMKLPFERIDVGGAFGKTKEPAYLAMNPNSLVPTRKRKTASRGGSRIRSSVISPAS
jgi:glutathione S-transferase